MSQEVIDLLKSEVDAVLYRVLEVENMTEAVRSDLAPEIAALGDGVERCGTFGKICDGTDTSILRRVLRRVSERSSSLLLTIFLYIYDNI